MGNSDSVFVEEQFIRFVDFNTHTDLVAKKSKLNWPVGSLGVFLMWKLGRETIESWVREGYVPIDSAQEIFKALASKEENEQFLLFV